MRVHCGRKPPRSIASSILPARKGCLSAEYLSCIKKRKNTSGVLSNCFVALVVRPVRRANLRPSSKVPIYNVRAIGMDFRESRAAKMRA
jgi:hypothetical protein